MRLAGIAGVTRRKTTYRRHRRVGEVSADLVDRQFSPTEPDRLWLADIERHEAFSNRAVVKGHPPRARRSEHVEGGGSLNPGTGGRVDSSPDNDGTGQYCQMVWVRQVRQKGIREEPASERFSREPAARTWRIRSAQQRAPTQ